jgi:hypothetical protein
MGRKKRFERPTPPPAGHDPALLEAVKAAFAALSAVGREVSPTAIEEWIKVNRFDVWSSLGIPALKGAIEAVKREPPEARPAITTAANREEANGRPRRTAKGTGARARARSEPAPRPPASPRTTRRTSGMGRKKKTEQRQPPAAQPARSEPAGAGNGDQDSLAQVVRKALTGVGTEADNEEVRAWITRNYPGREFNPTTLNTTISNQRSRLRRESRPPAAPAPAAPAGRQAAPRPAPRPSTAPGYDPTRSELVRVLAIARQESSVSKLRKMVQTVKQLADQVGGLEQLAVCLDTLEEFGLK